MLDRLFSPHLSNLQNSLGRTTFRQGLLTENLANANTPGYKRKDSDFAIQLQSQLEGSQGSRLQQVRSDAGEIRVDGSSVDVEREVFSIAETEMRYQVLTDITAQYFTGLKNVIKEGR